MDVKHTNGVPKDIERKLDLEMTTGYVPQLPIQGMFTTDSIPIFWMRRDIESMLWHPTVRQALGYFKAGIAGAEFWGGANPHDAEDEEGLPISEDERVSTFVKDMCERYWDRGVPKLQHGYEYGWVGSECIYETKEVREWKKLEVFSPSDTYLLTQDHKPVGVRVKNVKDKSYVDLWSADGDIPAKGLWYAHKPRYNRFYGISQLLGAWRPWRRLAWKDGAETVVDGGFYRFAYQGPIGRFPDEDLQGPNPGGGNTTLDSQGNPRRFARDIVRQICEQYKAGAAIGLPSKRDKDGNYLYDIQLPSSTMSGIEGLLGYVEYLQDQITQGIGVPPELLEASETGSGYSGRRIPLEAFLDTQQQIADAMLTLFIEQVLKPLVLWNFGNIPWTVKVKRLINTKTKASMQNQEKQGQPGQQVQRPPMVPRPPQPQPMPQPAAAMSIVQAKASDLAAILDRARRRAAA